MLSRSILESDDVLPVATRAETAGGLKIQIPPQGDDALDNPVEARGRHIPVPGCCTRRVTLQTALASWLALSVHIVCTLKLSKSSADKT